MIRIAALLFVPLLCGAFLGDDVVETKDGKVYKGEIIRETDRYVRIRYKSESGRRITKTIYKRRISAISRGGTRRDLGKEGGEGARTTRSREAVEDLIKKVGRTPPKWWDSVRLNYPKTLDLSWPMPAPGGWNNKKNVGQFVWDVINPNPGRWREGIKFMNHIMKVNKNKKDVVVRAMKSMARMYHDFLEDWPRAAFWWRLAHEQEGSNPDTINLAHCYWMMGSREMAEEILRKFSWDGTRHAAVCKLWSDIGEHDKAVQMALDRAKRTPDVGYLAAADAYRAAGKYSKAMEHYQKVIDSNQGNSGDVKRNKQRARESLKAVKLFEALDLKRVAGGRYSGSAMGYNGPVEVEVTVVGGKITDVKTTKHKEKQFYSALTDTPRRIIEKQSVKGIDATTNATITSEAVINAAAQALSKGVR